jgi:hypothetical protein
MDKRQTAIFTIIEKFNILSDNEFKTWFLNSMEKLEAMEKVQIIEAHMNAQPFNGTMFLNAQDYYNETYGK